MLKLFKDHANKYMKVAIRVIIRTYYNIILYYNTVKFHSKTTATIALWYFNNFEIMRESIE
jgi:hypothetical protein